MVTPWFKIAGVFVFGCVSGAGMDAAELKAGAVVQRKNAALVIRDERCVVGRPLDDRAYWQKMAMIIGPELISRAEDELKRPLTPWSDEAYLEYSRNGSRALGQQMLGPRWERMKILALAELLENRGRFLAELEHTLLELAKQPSWVLPAHDHGMENFYHQLHSVDLSAASNGADVAMILVWLGQRLSPQTREIVAASLQRYVIQPTYAAWDHRDKRMQDRHFWRRADMNWNAVCTAGTTTAILATETSAEMRRRAVEEALNNAQTFLSGFTADGYCSEGVGYWGYGFGRYLSLAEILRVVTSGKVDLYQAKHVREIAKFPEEMSLDGKVYPIFADGTVGTGADETVCWWSEVAVLGRKSPRISADSVIQRLNSLVQWVQVAEMCLNVPDRSPALKTKLPLRSEFPDGGVRLWRVFDDKQKVSFAVAMKAANNDEHHNHNDEGTYVVVSDGRDLVLDPGRTEYTAETFSPRRYQHPILGSYGHSVPVVNGKQQRAGAQAVAKEIRHEIQQHQDEWTVDLGSCYDEPTLRSLQRTWILRRDATPQLVIRDDVRFRQPATFSTAVVMRGECRKAADGVYLVREDDSCLRLTITASSPLHFKFEKIANPKAFEPIRLGIEIMNRIDAGKIEVTVCPAPLRVWKEAQPVVLE